VNCARDVAIERCGATTTAPGSGSSLLERCVSLVHCGQALWIRRRFVRAALSSAGGSAVDPRTTSSVANST